MRGNLKYYGLLALLSFCVVFSLISLWETQSLVGQNPSLDEQNNYFNIKQEVVVPSTAQTPSPFPTSSIQLQPSQETPNANTVTLEASSTASPSVPAPSLAASPSPVKTPSPSKVPTAVKSPSRSPAKPSITPTPFTIFIPTSIHGNRTSEERGMYLDTTVNTPLQVNLEAIFGDWILEASKLKLKQPSYGTLRIDDENPHNITYIPKPWYCGLDSFELETFRIVDGMVEEWNGTVNIRIRTGLVLNQALLAPPSSYIFSEANSIASIEIRKALKNLQNTSVVPEQDNWLNRRYKTCAVVGNGGSLRGRKHGAEIDSHEVVVRLNLAPMTNYSEDIGSRLDIAFSNGPTYSNCWRRNDTDLPNRPNYEVVAQASFKPHWTKLPNCIKYNTNIKYLPMNYLFVDLVDNILNDYQNASFSNTTKKYRSTGMLAVTAMSMVCDHISVYGFERGANMENHYYNSTYEREWHGHSYTAEKAFFADLAHGKGIFEKHLQLYDLYTSFSYIVD